MKDLVYEVYLLSINYCGQINSHTLIGKVRNYYIADHIVKGLLELDLHNEMVLVVDTREKTAKAKLQELTLPVERIRLMHKLEKGDYIV